MDLIHLLVKTPTALRKIPCVVLVGLAKGISPAKATAADVQGAVLLYEYMVGDIGTGVFATDDITGERTVLAPPELRAEIAEKACRILAAHGAAISLVSLERTSINEPQVKAHEADGPPCHIATRVRIKERDLILHKTMDETLASLGKNTRRNFRRYRTRLEEDLGVTFVPWVRISPEDFIELHCHATNPVSVSEAAWRYHFLSSSSDRLFAGMRDANGRWLSLIGGSRHRDYVQIDWQVNRNDLPRYSLSTVMRSYLLEHEIALGTRRILFKGGTPHTMRLSLLPAETLDIVVVRHSFRGWLLRNFARWLPPSNFLGRTLADNSLAWIS